MSQNKQRDAAQTKDRILQAAGAKFSQKGYDGAGTREIADLAEANIALVTRYFGSKENLFREAVLPGMTMAPLMIGDMESIPARIAHYMTTKNLDGPMTLDPTQAILRSMGNETVAPMIRDALGDKVVDELSDSIKGDDAKLRSILVIAFLFGLDAMMRVMHLSPEEKDEKQAMEKLIKETLEGLMLPEALQETQG
ncbi:TetR family transcriptional regulator [Pseudovibrio denitrificans]|uniref:TetR/AcrR family transcriptional regulator n=1 Tax=Pseudovibrio denitrificans TaxID=258256 RepID=UPI0039BF846B